MWRGRRLALLQQQNLCDCRLLSSRQRASQLQSDWTVPIRWPSTYSRQSSSSSRRNVIEIKNATFYRKYPSPSDTGTSNPPLFPKLSFTLPQGDDPTRQKPQFWAVLASCSLARTTFLQILAGQYICVPPRARTYPYLPGSPQHDIKYVGFDAERGNNVGGNNVRGAYLSARYESRREETDYSLLDYLQGNTELNALEHETTAEERQNLDDVVEMLSLRKLLQMPVANLSNGQTRRARIAKALISKPEILLLDGPFMGLDPNTLATMEKVLHAVAETQRPRIIMSLRPEDGIPSWVDHLVLASDELKVEAQGPKTDILARMQQAGNLKTTKSQAISKDGWPQDSPSLAAGEPLIEMQGVKVAYGDKVVLGDWEQVEQNKQKAGLWWSLHRGQRCGIFGPNGSGKTTMLSLITSDHPQTYSLPIRIFGKSRLPGSGETGISVFDIQKRMGHSSPEVHAFFPKQLSVRRALESAWADAPLAKPKLTSENDRRVDAFLRWFARDINPNMSEPSSLEKVEAAYNSQPQVVARGAGDRYRLKSARDAYAASLPFDDSDIAWADDLRFRELSFSSQRLVLFLRALVATPDLVILDEALSGVDEPVRDKALLFLSHGEKLSTATSKDGKPEPSVLARLEKVSFEGLSPEQALLVISHTKADVPGCLREWICLPEPGEGRMPRTGTLSGPLELNPEGWDQIWGRDS